MTEMVKRGGIALLKWDGPLDAVPVRQLAEAVLCAALDPEDEALVDEVARSMIGAEGLSEQSVVWRKWKDRARRAIAALKNAAQGERDAV
jgi:hypothetical protein